jgi:F-type H+-transporting ATPase subunit delta
VLLQNQRLTEVPEINRKLAEILDERAGMVAATVTTARPVPNDIQRSLEQRLTAVTQKKVRLNFEQDPDLIGGLVTRIGSTAYDGSVRNQLELIKERMTA